MIVCISCDKLISFEEYKETDSSYHKACHKSKMDTTDYIDPKMDLKTYPVKHVAQKMIETQEEQYGQLYKVLGAAKATQWIMDNVYQDINMEDEFHKLMEGDTE